jgi:hypothetical protein
MSGLEAAAEEVGRAETFVGAQPAGRVRFQLQCARPRVGLRRTTPRTSCRVAGGDAAGDGQGLAEVCRAAGHLGRGALQLAVEAGVVEEELQAAGTR